MKAHDVERQGEGERERERERGREKDDDLHRGTINIGECWEDVALMVKDWPSMRKSPKSIHSIDGKNK